LFFELCISFGKVSAHLGGSVFHDFVFPEVLTGKLQVRERSEGCGLLVGGPFAEFRERQFFRLIKGFSVNVKRLKLVLSEVVVVDFEQFFLDLIFVKRHSDLSP
jgi:hypothetical protein